MKINIRKIEIQALKIFEVIFNLISRKFSYTFALAVTTSLYGFLIAVYAGLFIVTTVAFPNGSENNFITLFIILICAVYAPGYYSHFGMLKCIGVPCFSKNISIVNTYIKGNNLEIPRNPETARDFLKSLEGLPKKNMYASLIYSSVVMIVVVIQEMMQGTVYRAGMICIGIMSAIYIYVFVTYITSELLTGPKRREVKKYLMNNGIEYTESYSLSIRHKFVFINIMILIAMVELSIMFYASSSLGLIIRPVQFIIVASVMIGSILFFYLISIENSLLEIEYAALDLASGGKGRLFQAGLDREIVNTGRGLISASREVNDMRMNLEKKVDDRTSQLNLTMNKLQDTFNEIQELKSQQDGDYFLTSLLIEPLGKNKAKCDNIKMEFIVKQKKTFSFRKWKKEIGGDICVTQNIYLKGKEYAVFLTADAMGKSMQGAGGILVLGAGFKAILEKNRFSSFDQDLYPEQWLRNTITELQSVFETFDGSMLISFVIGLIDDATGVLYYVNAEHPWIILYRDKKADFMDEEHSLRKLGIIDESPVMIKLFKMEVGDIIIIGSDGKDDLYIHKDGKRVMNEDERLFLSFVEKGDGDLDRVYRILAEEGEITDDLSIMRISYRDDYEDKFSFDRLSFLEDIKLLLHENKVNDALEILERLHHDDKENPIILKEFIKLLINIKKDYKKAAQYIDKYVDLKPEDTEFIFVSSVCFEKIKNFKKSEDYAVRAYLRNPLEIKYILQLAKVNFYTKNYINADKLLDKVLKLDPYNSRALKLKSSL